MPKLFDEFDLDLRKITKEIQLYGSDGTTQGSDCMCGGGPGGGSIMTTLGWDCISKLICPSDECQENNK